MPGNSNSGRRTEIRSPSKSGRAVIAWLAEYNWTITELAHELRRDRGTVTRWLTGERVPSLEDAVLLRDACGVATDGWL